MTTIATLNILSFKWQPPKLWTDENEQEQLAERIPRQTFDSRITQLQRLVRSKCPSSHIEYYAFVFIIICIACSVAFSLAARSADISMWYPLVLLLIPAALSFWTNRRHASLVTRIKKFERSLKQTLKEFNKFDNTAHRVQWSLRRPTVDDTLPSKFQSARLCLVIQVSLMSEDVPPPYQAAVMTSLYRFPPPPYSELDIIQQQSRPQTSSASSSHHLQTGTGTITENFSSQSSLLSVPEPAVTRSSPHENSSTVSSATPPNNLTIVTAAV